MEDSHIVSLDVGEGVAVFGVFDGHGGEWLRWNNSNFREWGGSIREESFCKRAEKVRDI